MTAARRRIVEEGALGFSTALLYPPAITAPTNELIPLARAARRHSAIYASHIRNEAAHEDAALEEAFRIGREAGIPVEIWHLKVSGKQRWGRMPLIMAKIDSARSAGPDLPAVPYPYIAAATSLEPLSPQRAHSVG